MQTTPLRTMRHIRGLSLEIVAKAIGSDTGNLSRIETGAQVAGKDIAARLVTFYAPCIDELHVIYPERYIGWSPDTECSKSSLSSASDAKISA